ncbi:hypothetical protein BC832DRAFT_544021 [Gaertneriomyces semiglobifer]|nr:hypothetical protein BC832DRAFT_544021 [Gaertneriomyces semiglobifer]
MGFKVESSIVINAEPARVHEVICDFAKYPDWNPFFKHVTGTPDWTPKEGQNLIAWAAQPLRLSVPIPVHVDTVTQVSKTIKKAAKGPFELRWSGGVNVPLIGVSVFEGSHYFISKAVEGDPTKTLFVHGEDFGGIASIPLGWTKDWTIQGKYDALNKAVKKRVEAGAE